MPSQKPGTARKKMLRKRTRLSAKLLGRSALTSATGMPTSQDRITDRNRDLCGERAAARDHLGDAFRAEEGTAELAVAMSRIQWRYCRGSGSLRPSSAM